MDTKVSLCLFTIFTRGPKPSPNPGTGGATVNTQTTSAGTDDRRPVCGSCLSRILGHSQCPKEKRIGTK